MPSFIRFFTEDRYSYFFIILNGFALFCLGFAKEPGTIVMDDENLFWVMIWFGVDYLCVVYFLIEAVFKIRLFGKDYWRDGWNRFDFLVLAVSLPVLVEPIFYLGDFRVATLLRLGRLFRLFRLLRIIPDRDRLISGVTRAIRSSIGVFLALFLLIFIISLGSNFLFGSQAPELFGNPLKSFYSTFKVFTIEGWYEIPEAMTKGGDMDPLWTTIVRLFFMAVVLICGILGLSLANAVFVDEMVMDNTESLETKVDHLTQQVKALREELARYHQDRDG
ncbi:MAG: ion transporter [Acidobacteriota bacterium]|nr:ion transporter [Acidobacteriota bacterium]